MAFLNIFFESNDHWPLHLRKVVQLWDLVIASLAQGEIWIIFFFTFTGSKETYGDLVHISMLLITPKHKLRIQIILHLARHFVFNFLGITIFLTFACQPFVEYRTFRFVHIQTAQYNSFEMKLGN